MSDHSEVAFPDHHHHGFGCRYSERALRPRPHSRFITATSEENNDNEQEATRNFERTVRIDRRLGALGRSPAVEGASEVEAQLG